MELIVHCYAFITSAIHVGLVYRMMSDYIIHLENYNPDCFTSSVITDVFGVGEISVWAAKLVCSGHMICYVIPKNRKSLKNLHIHHHVCSQNDIQQWTMKFCSQFFPFKYVIHAGGHVGQWFRLILLQNKIKGEKMSMPKIYEHVFNFGKWCHRPLWLCI